MANVTSGGFKGWRESINVYGVFIRCANQHIQPAPILIYTTEKEAIESLDNQIARAYSWDKNRVVAGCVKHGQTIKEGDQIECLKITYTKGTLKKPMPQNKP